MGTVKVRLQVCNPPSLSGGSRHCSAAAGTGTCYYQSLPSWSLWFLACTSSCLCSAEHLVAYRGIWAGSSRGHGHYAACPGEETVCHLRLAAIHPSSIMGLGHQHQHQLCVSFIWRGRQHGIMAYEQNLPKMTFSPSPASRQGNCNSAKAKCHHNNINNSWFAWNA